MHTTNLQLRLASAIIHPIKGFGPARTRANVARRTLNLGLLSRLSQTTDPMVWKAVAENPLVDKIIQEVRKSKAFLFANHSIANVRAALAEVSSNPQVLQKLAQDRHLLVIEAVAMNQQAQAEIVALCLSQLPREYFFGPYGYQGRVISLLGYFNATMQLIEKIRTRHSDPEKWGEILEHLQRLNPELAKRWEEYFVASRRI